MASVIAEELGMALLKGIAGAIGAKIFNSIFPHHETGVPDYFDEVYKEIVKIVKKEIQQNTINEINGQINGVIQWCKNVYTPRRDSEASSKRELFDMIKQNEYDIAVHMIAVLQEPAFAEPGLGVFVIAAGIHLTLLQELALVDPNVSDPNKSSYAESLKLYAEQYAAFADKTFDLIAKIRADDTIFTNVTFSTDGNTSYPYTSPNFYFYSQWTDKFLPKTYQDNTIFLYSRMWTRGSDLEMQERSKKTRSDYIDQVRKDLVTSLHDPKGVAKLWRQLKEHPIPTQALVF